MIQRSRWLRVKVLVGVAAMAAAIVCVDGASAPAATCHVWTAPPPPDPGDAELWGVAATSSCNAWAVGSYIDGTGHGAALVMRWNGTAWAKQQIPPLGAGAVLYAVTATSAKNAWAVGLRYNETTAHTRTVIVRWNGAGWRTQTSPNASAFDNLLEAVDATSSSNAWAVGRFKDASDTDRTLALHWNGTRWTRTPTPNVGNGVNELAAVAVTSRTNAWAVGNHDAGGSYRSLALHWNGVAWQVQKGLPVSNGQEEALWGVTATSSSNAWAVGSYRDDTTMNFRTFILRWNGTSWKRQSTPNPGTGDNELWAISAISGSDAWAVGDREDADIGTLVLHWDGARWRVQPSPDVPGSNELFGVSASSSPGDVWAVGRYNALGSFGPLAIHCC